MKNIKSLMLSAVVAVGLLSSCAVTRPYAVTGNPIGSKTGVSTTGVVFGVIQLNGKHGVQDANKNGGITGGISTVDIKYSHYGFPAALFFMQREVIVTGE